jgi:pyridoxine kinase
VPDALAAAASAIHEVLQTTLDLGEEELQLVAAQDRFLKPRRVFTVESL